jgi:hypothetical protein
VTGQREQIQIRMAVDSWRCVVTVPADEVVPAHPSDAAFAHGTNHELRAIGDGQRVRVLTR